MTQTFFAGYPATKGCLMTNFFTLSANTSTANVNTATASRSGRLSSSTQKDGYNHRLWNAISGKEGLDEVIKDFVNDDDYQIVADFYNVRSKLFYKIIEKFNKEFLYAEGRKGWKTFDEMEMWDSSRKLYRLLQWAYYNIFARSGHSYNKSREYDIKDTALELYLDNREALIESDPLSIDYKVNSDGNTIVCIDLPRTGEKIIARTREDVRRFYATEIEDRIREKLSFNLFNEYTKVMIDRIDLFELNDVLYHQLDDIIKDAIVETNKFFSMDVVEYYLGRYRVADWLRDEYIDYIKYRYKTIKHILFKEYEWRPGMDDIIYRFMSKPKEYIGRTNPLEVLEKVKNEFLESFPFLK